LRTTFIYTLNHPENFKEQLLSWSQQFNEVVWLDSNQHKDNYSSYDAILAVDAFTVLKTDYFDAFNRLDEYQSSIKDWIFGYLTYDLKNTTEHLKSKNYDGLEFPDLYFFQPKKLFLIKDDKVEIKYLKMVDDDIDNDLLEIEQFDNLTIQQSNAPIKIKLRIHKDKYFEKANQMLARLQHQSVILKRME